MCIVKMREREREGEIMELFRKIILHDFKVDIQVKLVQFCFQNTKVVDMAELKS